MSLWKRQTQRRKTNSLNRQSNSSARAAHFCVLFFAITARYATTEIAYIVHILNLNLYHPNRDVSHNTVEVLKHVLALLDSIRNL